MSAYCKHKSWRAVTKTWQGLCSLIYFISPLNQGFYFFQKQMRKHNTQEICEPLGQAASSRDVLLEKETEGDTASQDTGV